MTALLSKLNQRNNNRHYASSPVLHLYAPHPAPHPVIFSSLSLTYLPNILCSTSPAPPHLSVLISQSSPPYPSLPCPKPVCFTPPVPHPLLHTRAPHPLLHIPASIPLLHIPFPHPLFHMPCSTHPVSHPLLHILCSTPLAHNPLLHTPAPHPLPLTHWLSSLAPHPLSLPDSHLSDSHLLHLTSVLTLFSPPCALPCPSYPVLHPCPTSLLYIPCSHILNHYLVPHVPVPYPVPHTLPLTTVLHHLPSPL